MTDAESAALIRNCGDRLVQNLAVRALKEMWSARRASPVVTAIAPLTRDGECAELIRETGDRHLQAYFGRALKQQWRPRELAGIERDGFTTFCDCVWFEAGDYERACETALRDVAEERDRAGVQDVVAPSCDCIWFRDGDYERALEQGTKQAAEYLAAEATPRGDT